MRTVRRPVARRSRRSRRIRLALVALVAVVVIALLAPVPLVLRPNADDPGDSDVVLVLGPPDPERMALAERLMAQGHAKALVVSIDSRWTAARLPACSEPRPYPVTCFQPDPATTRGEGMELRRLADAQGWHSVQAITFDWHVNRARDILGRCYAGAVRVLAVPGYHSVKNLAHHVAGWYKVPFQRTC